MAILPPSMSELVLQVAVHTSRFHNASKLNWYFAFTVKIVTKMFSAQ